MLVTLKLSHEKLRAVQLAKQHRPDPTTAPAAITAALMGEEAGVIRSIFEAIESE